MKKEIQDRTQEQDEAYNNAVDAILAMQESYLDTMNPPENLSELEEKIANAVDLGLKRFDIEYSAAEELAKRRNMTASVKKVEGDEIITKWYSGMPHYTLRVKPPEEGTIIYTGNVHYNGDPILLGHCRRFAEGFGPDTWQLRKREVFPGSPRSWKRNAGNYSAEVVVLVK